MKKGEILQGKKRNRKAAYHYMVYLEGNNDGSFVAAVLTHSAKQDNIPMKEDHFKDANGDGKKYKFNFDNTFLVGRRFIKPKEWAPYLKIGELTEEGIKFVE